MSCLTSRVKMLEHKQGALTPARIIKGGFLEAVTSKLGIEACIGVYHSANI